MRFALVVLCCLVVAPVAHGYVIEGDRWPTVRIVPNLLDRPGRGFATSWEGEVTVFVGPPTGVIANKPVEPAVLVHEAMHHLVDPQLVGRGCPAFDATYAAVKDTPGLALAWPTVGDVKLVTKRKAWSQASGSVSIWLRSILSEVVSPLTVEGPSTLDW